jgi:ribosomal protein S27AE
MATPEKFEVYGKNLVCPHCGNDTFYTRESLLNTAGMAFFKLEWMNQPADNYICAMCGHIEWFHPMEG